MVPCSFPPSCSKSFKEFVPYALRNNQNVQIPLLKSSWPLTFFHKASGMWNFCHSQSDLQPATPFSWIAWIPINTCHKAGTHRLLGISPNLTPSRCMLRPRSVEYHQNNYRFCVCGNTETELHHFFHCSVHSTACVALYINFRGILVNTDLLNALILWATLICCDCFYLVYRMHRAQFQLMLLALLTTFRNCVIHSDCTGYDVLGFSLCLLLIFLCRCLFQNSTWRDKIAPLKLPPVARLSLNK